MASIIVGDQSIAQSLAQTLEAARTRPGSGRRRQPPADPEAPAVAELALALDALETDLRVKNSTAFCSPTTPRRRSPRRWSRPSCCSRCWRRRAAPATPQTANGRADHPARRRLH